MINNRDKFCIFTYQRVEEYIMKVRREINSYEYWSRGVINQL